MPPTLRQKSVQQADLELAKWLALIAMAVDHYGKIVEPELILPTHAIGRVSFPLFATIIGVRLATRPSLAASYIKRLLLWAVISQPVFVFVGRDWYDGNIMFTLLAGVVATVILGRYERNRSSEYLAAMIALVAIAWFADYGIAGAAMIPVTVFLTSRRSRAGLYASGPLGLAANLRPKWPPLEIIDFAALFATPIATISARSHIRLPRLPTHIFYAFYPAHLLALHYIDLAMRD